MKLRLAPTLGTIEFFFSLSRPFVSLVLLPDICFQIFIVVDVSTCFILVYLE